MPCCRQCSFPQKHIFSYKRVTHWYHLDMQRRWTWINRNTCKLEFRVQDSNDRLKPRPCVPWLFCKVTGLWLLSLRLQGANTGHKPPWGLLSHTGYISTQSRLISSSSHSRLVLIFVRFHGQSWILLPMCSFYKPKPVLMLYSQLLAQDLQEAWARWGISTACLMTWHGVHI